VIHHLTTPEEMSLFKDAFVRIYPGIFATPPYEEKFEANEVEDIFDSYARCKGCVFLAVEAPTGAFVGFAVGVPLTSRPQVASEVGGLVPVKHTFYLADLGVAPEWRGSGLVAELVRQRIRCIDGERYTHVLLRIAGSGHSTTDFYESIGFQKIGVSMQVRHARMDGTVRSDERHFMSRVLSQVVLGD